MQFPFELTKSETAVSDDLSQLPLDSRYVACFGKAKHITALDKFTALRSLWLSGVNEKQAALVPKMDRVETLVIHDLRTPTLSILGSFPNLRTLLIWGNTKATKLTELSALKSLRVLGLEHFPKIRNIDEIGSLEGLEMLCLTGSMDTALKLDTLTPLANLKHLELLHITNLKVADESLSFVENLRRLKELQVSNQFPTEEYAALKAKCSQVKCTHFAPYIYSNLKCDNCGADQAMVIGKRKPFVCPSCSPLKLEKYQSQFENMVANAT
ncbi:internalin G [Marinobacter santoriniensis NKSG1]|uniref:Internalin G n=1 Tax=Marinobacter santoriniensis NKSG1 TaxID=1288826 RepID=M7CQX8_9GAMM|nr:hypothetical protein [Marinobacter santoriniensis]EMP54490.1 internalin G [Marinobacter santoriniensis NKSG1]